MSNIDKKEILDTASLAKIALTNAEVLEYTAELSNVLGMMEKINEVDISNVEPMNHPIKNLTQRLRDDTIETEDSASQKIIINNAPKMANNLFLVPKIIEENK